MNFLRHLIPIFVLVLVVFAGVGVFVKIASSTFPQDHPVLSGIAICLLIACGITAMVTAVESGGKEYMRSVNRAADEVKREVEEIERRKQDVQE